MNNYLCMCLTDKVEKKKIKEESELQSLASPKEWPDWLPQDWCIARSHESFNVVIAYSRFVYFDCLISSSTKNFNFFLQSLYLIFKISNLSGKISHKL